MAFHFYAIIVLGHAPYVTTSNNINEAILENITIANGSKIYELGCGTADFLQAAEKKSPNSTFIGIEYNLLPFLLAKILLFINRSHIQLLHKNFFNIQLNDADIIFCYLNEASMKKLEPKFLSECKPKTQIISHTFHLPNITPIKTLTVDGHKILFYIT